MTDLLEFLHLGVSRRRVWVLNATYHL